MSMVHDTMNNLMTNWCLVLGFTNDILTARSAQQTIIDKIKLLQPFYLLCLKIDRNARTVFGIKLKAKVEAI